MLAHHQSTNTIQVDDKLTLKKGCPQKCWYLSGVVLHFPGATQGANLESAGPPEWVLRDRGERSQWQTNLKGSPCACSAQWSLPACHPPGQTMPARRGGNPQHILHLRSAWHTCMHALPTTFRGVRDRNIPYTVYYPLCPQSDTTNIHSPHFFTQLLSDFVQSYIVSFV